MLSPASQSHHSCLWSAARGISPGFMDPPRLPRGVLTGSHTRGPSPWPSVTTTTPRPTKRVCVCVCVLVGWLVGGVAAEKEKDSPTHLYSAALSAAGRHWMDGCSVCAGLGPPRAEAQKYKSPAVRSWLPKCRDFKQSEDSELDSETPTCKLSQFFTQAQRCHGWWSPPTFEPKSGFRSSNTV